MTRLVVLGDVHGNATALRAALARAVRTPFDRMIFVGDLLTFGHDVEEVLELVGGAQHRHGATLLVGNHDRTYFELQAGNAAAFEAMPAWVRPSVELTFARLAGIRYRDALAWSEEIVIDEVLITHANPFAVGDTRYLTTDDDAREASKILAARGLRVGIFGHTHRPRWGGLGREHEPPLDTRLVAQPTAPFLINAGAVGQPRDVRARSVVLRLTCGEELAGEFETIEYDVAGHLERVRASGLPATTIQRLQAFFEVRS